MIIDNDLDFGCALWGDEDVDYSFGNKYDLTLFFEHLICFKGVNRFYFNNFRPFNKFCWEIITELKKDFPHIKRIWVVKEYAFNLMVDNYPYGMTSLDFEDRQYIRVTNPKTSREEFVRSCKSIMELSLYNIFCFSRGRKLRKKPSYSEMAYNCCVNLGKDRIIYNVYVPLELRKYQPI